MPLHDVVGSLIIERPLCFECIATAGNILFVELDPVLTNLAHVVPLAVKPGRCRQCGVVRLIYAIGSPVAQ